MPVTRKLGRKPVRHDKRTLQLARYLNDTALPELPASYDVGAGVTDWPMYANDRLGDCTVASAGHMIQAWGHASGKRGRPTESAIENAYWNTGTEDDGRVELDVLGYWRNHGIGLNKISAYAAIDPGNLAHVHAAIFLFGGVYTGLALPLTAEGKSSWAVEGVGLRGRAAPGSWGGHAVPYIAYSAGYLATITWGERLLLTEGFHAAYCEEAYALIDVRWLTRAGSSPAGFDLERLTADLLAITAR